MVENSHTTRCMISERICTSESDDADAHFFGSEFGNPNVFLTRWTYEGL